MRSWFIGLGVTALGLGATLLFVRPEPRPPGELIPREDLIIWRAPWGGESAPTTAEARFEVVNRGGRPVRITGIMSGCGCADPKVTPTRVDPGQSAAVLVSARPFPTGEKEVPLTLYTDSPRTPEVELRLKLIGTTPPPYVLQFTGELTYLGSIDRDEAREIEVVTIEPLEKTISPSIQCDLPFFTFEPVGEQEAPYTAPEVLARTYRFRVRLTGSPPGNTFAGAARVRDPWNPERELVLPVSGQLRPPLRVVPTSLTLEGDQPTSFSVLTEGNDAGAVTVEPAPGVSRCLLVAPVGGTGVGPIRRFTVRRIADEEPGSRPLGLVVRPAPGSPATLTVPIRIARSTE